MLKPLYNKLVPKRDQRLMTYRNISEVTVPTLFPPDGYEEGSAVLKHPANSAPARSINQLAGKLTLALFPPQGHFFVCDVDDQVRKSFVDEKASNQLSQSLLAQTNAIHDYMRNRILYHRLYETLRYILVGGNICIHVTEDTQMRLLPMNSYAVKRHPDGTVMYAIIKETYYDPGDIMAEEVVETESELYTGIQSIRFSDGTRGTRVTQVLHKDGDDKGIIVTQHEYVKDACPYIFPVGTLLPSFDYGSSLCEDYIGDIRSSEGLTQNMLDFAAAASFIVFLVKPGATSVQALRNAHNLQFLSGNPEDVGTLQIGKLQDFQVVANLYDTLKRGLSSGFAETSAIQRSGERVTASEIDKLSQSLETSLGGLYSLLAASLQVPLVSIVQHQMIAKQLLPPMPADAMSIKITGGYEALGKGHDADRLMLFGERCATVQQAAPYVQWDQWVAQYEQSLGLSKLSKDAGTVQEEQQVEQANATAADVVSKAAPGLMPSGG